MSVPLSTELHLRGIDPRKDKDYVILLVGRALDNCDPDERPIVSVTRPYARNDNHRESGEAQR